MRSTAGVRAAARVGAVLGLGLLVAGPAWSQRAPDRFAPAWAPVREFFHRTLAEEGMVGGSLMFFHGDTVLAREFFGQADLETRRPVDERTVFHWASITKTFTAVALLQLRDRGRLGLDDPILKYLPELRVVHNPFGPMEAVTLRHLVSHSAGFRNGTWPWGGNKPWHPFEPTQWSQLVAMMPYTEILFPPGSKFSYSNPGVIFLGKTIEALSGEDYEVYLDKNVLRPLGMTASYFDRTPYHLLPFRSNNYAVKGGKPEPQGLDFDTGITVSNGGLNAPLPDMIRYLQFLAGAPGMPAAARGVLSRATLEEMWRPVVPVGGPEGDAMGLGFFLMERGGGRLIGHTGSQAGFRSFFYVDPATGAGVIAAFNAAPEDDPRNPTDQGPAKPRIGLIFSGLLERLTGGVFPIFRK
ncbi:MAG: serine hydrolase domain-containing protein [Gemmatimonadales bacterium]|nr:serine hydrolase domain-containing protein [Gemmatimonadales bacterium]